MIRAEVVGDLTDLVDRVAGGGGDLVELLGRRLQVGLTSGHGAEQGAVLHDQQVLSESVVQLGGNPLPFGLLRVDQLAGEDLLALRVAPQGRQCRR